MKKISAALSIFLLISLPAVACGEKNTPSRRDEVRAHSDQAMAELEREVKGGPTPIAATAEPERKPAPAKPVQVAREIPFAKKRPGWVGNPPSGPDTIYGVGVGSDLKAADDAARAEIAAQLKVTVSSSFTNTVQEAIKSSTQGKKSATSSQSQEFSESQIRSFVENTTLKGVAIEERWQEGGKTYSLAALSKQGFRDRAVSHLNEGDSRLAARAVAPALREYLKALGEAWVIPDLALPGSGESLALAAERKALDLINAITARVQPANPVLSARKELPLSVAVTLVYGNTTPISDLPVAAGFASGAGRLEAGMVSDAGGNFHFQVLSLSPSSRTAMLSLGPDLTRLAELPADLDLNRIFPPFPGGQVQISAPAPRVFIAVNEENLGQPQKPSFVESGLTEGLGAEGFVIIPRKTLAEGPEELLAGGLDSLRSAGAGLKADLLILGTAKAEYYKNIMGKFESSRVRVNLKVVDGNTGEVLTGLDRSDLTGSGATVELSATNALKEAAKKVPELLKDKLNQI